MKVSKYYYTYFMEVEAEKERLDVISSNVIYLAGGFRWEHRHPKFPLRCQRAQGIPEGDVAPLSSA